MKLINLAFAGIMLLASGCATITLDESILIRPNHSELLSQNLPAGYTLTEHTITRADGTHAYGVWVKHPDNQATVMYFGGNQFDVSSGGRRILDAFTAMGLNVVMFDHRGYGKSNGNPNVALLMQDAVSNYDFVTANTSHPVILHGMSLGSFEAGAVAKERPVAALVLEGSATHVDDWASTLVPWYASPFVDIKIDAALRQVNNLEVVAAHQAPLYIIVGEKDGQTPPSLSQKLYEHAVSSQKAIKVFSGMRHGNVMQHADFKTQYQAFLKSHTLL